ncbi:hypothetical protein [Flavobacterium alkalisoli]|uniref:hypothetical protein n=1 Tax=Flavobacterium alkalisoli TaxID=2602769 RepID=UPI003A8FE79D
MQKILLLLFSLLLVNCKEAKEEDLMTVGENTIAAESKETNGKEKEMVNVPKYIQPLQHNNKVLILKGELDIYNKNLKETGKAAGLYGLIVSTDSISKNRYDLTGDNDYCKLHNFVKVSHPHVKGWVYGKNVYEYDMSRDTAFTVNDIQFKIIPTKNFNVGVSDDEGLTFCGSGSPMVLYNSKFEKEEFIPIENKNEYYNSDYITYDSHDGWMDEIAKVSLKDDILLLDIFREYQEGSANIIFEIYLSKFGSHAIIKEVIYHEPE